MRVDAFDFDLPSELIAQQPAPQRDGSRLLVVDAARGRLHHEGFAALGKFLRPGDLLVVNDSRVLPARLLGVRERTSGKWEGLFLTAGPDGWRMLAKTRGRLEVGERIAIEGGGAVLEYRGRAEDGLSLLAPVGPCDPVQVLEAHGHVPLPPYIRGGKDSAFDRERYQTVYASPPGSVAAPTAGLHFTPELLAALERQGVKRTAVTLHVGLGTFMPVKADDIAEHRMHAESCVLSAEAAEALNATRAAGGRVVAVGTTAARVLETVADEHGRFAPFAGATEIFITPGHQFRGVDALLTNFHLPRSTLLMLVAAFVGREFALRAYGEAVRRRYRFYSYGDAMFCTRD